jgi:hypothetical protein
MILSIYQRKYIEGPAMRQIGLRTVTSAALRQIALVPKDFPLTVIFTTRTSLSRRREISDFTNEVQFCGLVYAQINIEYMLKNGISIAEPKSSCQSHAIL